MSKAGMFAGEVTPAAPANGAATTKAKSYQWMEYGLPAPTIIYTLFAGTSAAGREIIDYCSFDGTTITNLAQYGFVLNNPNASVTAYHALPTSDGGVVVNLSGNEIRHYIYVSSSGGIFYNTYGRFNDWDSLIGSADPGNMLELSAGKLLLGGAISPDTGLPNAIDVTKVASRITGYLPYAQSGYWFTTHNGYIITYDWNEGQAYPPADPDRYEDAIRAFSWDGSSLTFIDEENGMHPRDVPWQTSHRLASDGTYLYESCTYNYSGKTLWSMPDWGWHAGIQVMTFDGVTLTHIVISSDGIENQVPWYGSATPGTDEHDEAGVLSLACGNGYIFALGYNDNQGASGLYNKTLYSWTFDEVNKFVEIDTYDLGSSATNPAGLSKAYEIQYDDANKWLIVDAEGVWDVSDGTFNNRLVTGSFTPKIDASVSIAPRGGRGGALFTTPLEDNPSFFASYSAAVLRYQFPTVFFDFQDTKIKDAIAQKGVRSAHERDDWDKYLLQANNDTNFAVLDPIREGTVQYVRVDNTFLQDQGTTGVGPWYNNDNNSLTIFTIGCTGPVTQMAGFHCRDAADQTWSSYFQGSDLKLEFNSTTDEVLTFTFAGLADGNLHVIAFEVSGGAIQVNVDDAAMVSQSWTVDTRLKAVTKTFMFGDNAVWASQVSNGIFTDLFALWPSASSMSRSEVDQLVGLIHDEITTGA